MVFDATFPREMVQEQRVTSLLTALLGSIPLTIGKKIRWQAYRRIVGQMENGVIIGSGVELAGAKGLFFEEKCAVETNVFLNAWGPKSGRIILRKRCRLDRGGFIQAIGGCIEIGEQTYIGAYFCAAGPGDIKIGKNCMIASHCSMYANNHKYDDPDVPVSHQGATFEGIVIEDDCWLGTGVRVLDGVTIGRGSIIGAGAVVTKDIPPNSVAVGVPARVMAVRGKSKNAEVPMAQS